jgi:hypothetical protein
LKAKETVIEKHKKDIKERKGKSVLDETPQEESFGPEFPETVIFASFTDLPLTKISAQTEMVNFDDIEGFVSELRNFISENIIVLGGPKRTTQKILFES